MFQILKKLIMVILTGLLFIGCSESPSALDFKSAEDDLKGKTLSLFRLMAEGKETEVYRTLLHQKVKDTLSEDAFRGISKKNRTICYKVRLCFTWCTCQGY